MKKCLFCDNEVKRECRQYCSRACISRHRILGQREWNTNGYFKVVSDRKLQEH